MILHKLFKTGFKTLFKLKSTKTTLQLKLGSSKTENVTVTQIIVYIFEQDARIQNQKTRQVILTMTRAFLQQQ